MTYDLRHGLEVAGIAGQSHGWMGQMVGLLHDAVEDGACTLDELHEAGLAMEVVEAIDVLTRRPDERYRDYVDRIKASGNDLARWVKLADLDVNLARTDDEHRSLSSRYSEAVEVLSHTKRLEAARGTGAVPGRYQEAQDE